MTATSDPRGSVTVTVIAQRPCDSPRDGVVSSFVSSSPLDFPVPIYLLGLSGLGFHLRIREEQGLEKFFPPLAALLKLF